MKAVVDVTRCSGHARCYEIDPDLYRIDELGYASREQFDVPAGGESSAIEGAHACPERAITLE